MPSDNKDDSPVVKTDFLTSSGPLLRSQKKSQDHIKIDAEDGNVQFSGTSANQMVVFRSGSNSGEDIALPLNSEALNPSNRSLPSVGAFTVQCASCFKWRLIPTKEKYEQIRESILQIPFVCERAREWRPDISCDDQPDILQDGSRLWAIDKPNIAQPPPGWDRQLRIRGEGGTRFADV